MRLILWYLFLWLIMVGIVLFLARIVLFKTGLIYMVKKWWKTVVDVFHVYQSYKVPEFNNNMQENHLYMKVYAYLNSLSSMRIQISPTSSREKNQTRSSSAYIRTRSLETSFLQCRSGLMWCLKHTKKIMILIITKIFYIVKILKKYY